jgi:hypothetical protein
MVLKERRLLKKSLIFFSKSLKLKENYSILDDKCDIITVNKRVILFEGVSQDLQTPLPISICCEYAETYEEVTINYTEQEALLIAEEKMSKAVSDELPEAEMLTKNSSYKVNDGVLVLIWEIECIEDIAVEVPIGIV